MNLTLVPYGNAHQSFNKKITICQHGTAECLGNMYEACSLALYPDVHKHFPFFDCLEGSTAGISDAVAKQCATSAGLSASALYDCTQTQQGVDLINKMRDETNALNPPHTYVPWITVNGKVLQDPSTLQQAVCDAYTGTKPASCSGMKMKKALQMKPCMREE
jgi:interferon gamma-inducible protein 30